MLNLLQGFPPIQTQERQWGPALMLGVRSGSQSVFQFIPEVFDGVEVRALCRPVKFFHTKLGKPFLYGAALWRGHRHFETGKGQTQAADSKLEAHCCLKYHHSRSRPKVRYVGRGVHILLAIHVYVYICSISSWNTCRRRRVHWCCCSFLQLQQGVTKSHVLPHSKHRQVCPQVSRWTSLQINK